MYSPSSSDDDSNVWSVCLQKVLTSLIEPGSVAITCNTFPDFISSRLARVRSIGCGQFRPRTSSFLLTSAMSGFSYLNSICIHMFQQCSLILSLLLLPQNYQERPCPCWRKIKLQPNLAHRINLMK